MKVQSTGLGKTVMVAEFKGMSKTALDGQTVMMLTMESSEPLHWTIRVYMEPKDIRKAVLMGLRPSVMWRALMGLLFGRFSFFKKEASEETTARPAMAVETGSGATSSPGPEPAESGLSVLAKFKD